MRLKMGQRGYRTDGILNYLGSIIFLFENPFKNID